MSIQYLCVVHLTRTYVFHVFFQAAHAYDRPNSAVCSRTTFGTQERGGAAGRTFFCWLSGPWKPLLLALRGSPLAFRPVAEPVAGPTEAGIREGQLPLEPSLSKHTSCGSTKPAREHSASMRKRRAERRVRSRRAAECLAARAMKPLRLCLTSLICWPFSVLPRPRSESSPSAAAPSSGTNPFVWDASASPWFAGSNGRNVCMCFAYRDFTRCT